MQISLHRRIARSVLWLRTEPIARVMCRGYNQEFNEFTELIWKDDSDLEFWDKNSYPEFQLWMFPKSIVPYLKSLLKHS